jgi:hypothetical protein
MNRQIDVVGISIVMLSLDDEGKFEVLSQYPVPLKHNQKLNGLRHFSKRQHFCWDFIPVSE